MPRWIPLLCAAGLAAMLAACGGEPNDPQVGPDAGPELVDAGPCTVPCGAACCVSGQRCVDGRCEGACAPETEQQLCAREHRVCGSLTATDGCGQRRTIASCGGCTAGTCRADGTGCEGCVAESNDAFCERLGKECGSVTDRDNCGQPRTWNCGSCPAGASCDLLTNTCETTCAETDEAFCDRLGSACGSATGTDACGAPRTVAECGPCRAGEICDAQHQCKPCVPEPEIEFCSRLGKNCGEVTGTDNCGSPRTVPTCGNCVSPKVCNANNLCANPGAPLNDGCAAPELLTFDATTGIATAVGDTALADKTGDGTCNSGSGNDVVYRFSLAATRSLTVTVTPDATSGLKPNLYVRTACDQSAAEVGCATATTSGPGTLTLTRLAPGDYFLWVDGYASGSNGSFSLRAAIYDPSPAPANDTCAGAQSLAFDPATGKVTVTGDTTNAGPDDTATCATASAPFTGGDVVYRFSLSSQQSVNARLTRDSADAGFEPALYIRKTCSSVLPADEFACARGTSGTATAQANALSPGDYFVFVDGLYGSAGKFTLELTAGPAITNDTCAQPAALVFDASGIATATGDTRFVGNDSDGGSCNGQTGNDLVYSFSTTTTKNVEIIVTPDAAGSFKPNVFVQKACGQDTSELACKTTSSVAPVTVSLQKLPPGTYFVWVDAWYKTADGPFALKVTTVDVAGNDTCNTAAPLTFDATGTATVSGDTRVAANDGDGSCLAGTGPDVVYSFSTQQPTWAEIEVAPAPGSSFRPNVYLRSTCDVASTQVLCGTAPTGAPLKLTAKDLAAGTWSIWVDSATSGTAGAFSLKVRNFPPPLSPANDVCSRAEPLVFDPMTRKAAVTGVSTSAATDDYAGRCATASAAHSGADLVYSLTLSAPASIAAKATRSPATATFKPVVYIRKDACGSAAAADQAACANDASGVATATALNAPAGTYYVVVDGANGTFGDFELEVSLGAPVDLPDDCFTARELDLTSGSASVTGDTTAALDNSTSLLLGYVASGRDLVYRFTTATDITLTASLTFSGGTGHPVLYLRRACDATAAADEVAAKEASAGGPTVLTVNNLPAGTYWLWVDGYTQDQGPFSLQLTASSTNPPPPNDTCAQAEVVDVSSGTASVAGTTVDARDHSRGTCNATMVGGDVVYAVTLTGTQAQSLIATATRSATSSASFQPAVYIRADCGGAASADERGCGKQSSGVARAVAPRLSPGTYYVVVDGLTADTGTFTLDLAVGPERSHPDTCANAQSLAFGSSGAASVTNDTSLASDDATASCATYGTGRDYVYKIDTTGLGAKNLEARLAFTGSPNTVWPLMYLRTDCGTTSASNELACRKASSVTPLTITQNNLPEGVYYLWVDAAQSTDRGSFTLDVALTPPAPNESCSNPLVLTFSRDTASDFGFTTGALDDATGPCGSMTGGDVVYSFTVPGTTPVALTATVTRDPAFPSFQPALYLRSNCSSTLGSDQKACGVQVNGTAVAHAGYLDPGTYYLFVDGLTANGGAYDLQVALTPAETFPDTCTSPMPLSFDATGHVVVQGDTTTATDDFQSAGCLPPQKLTGRDLVYQVDTRGMGVRDLVAKVTYASGIYPMLSLRQACTTAATDELACIQRQSGGPLSLVKEGLAEGIYFLVVDTAWASDKGPFSLDIQLTPPPPVPANDGCAAAIPLVVNASGKASVTGSTRFGTHDASGTCATMDGADVVYSLQLQDEAQVTFKVTADALSPGFQPALYVRGDCTSAAATDEKACATATSGVAGATVLALPAGTWAVVVDGTAGTYGRFTLDVTVAAAQHGDKCADAARLSIDPTTGIATATGDTTLVAADVVSTCGWRDLADLVYTFTLSQPKKVDVLVTPGTAPGKFTASLRRGTCDGSKTDFACAYSSTDGAATSLSAPRLDPGTYFLWIEGYNNAKGPFTLKVTTSDVPSAPANDLCTGAEALSFDVNGKAIVQGVETTYATDGGAGSCDASASPDLVYSFTLQSEASVVAKVTRDATTASYNPVVYLRSNCASADLADELGCGKPTSGVASFGAGRLPAGTYYVVVDGLGGTAGKFKLEVTRGAAVRGDLCGDAIPLSFDATTGIAQVSGDTTLATNAANGSCATSGTGADQVYTFTLASPRKVDVQVTPAAGSALQPAVYLRTGCSASNTDVACKYASSVTSTSFSYPILAAGTWYVWVDGYSATRGAYTMKVTATTPATVASNDTCLGAAPMTWDGATNKFTASGDTSLASHDTSGTCDLSLGPDLVYSFTTSQPQKIVAKVLRDSTTTSYESVVYLRRACDRATPSDEQSCAKAVGGTATLTVQSLPADTWHLWVDGAKGTTGKFTVEVALQSPDSAPANEACFAPEVLVMPPTLPTTATVNLGTTLNAQNEASGTCGSTSGPDVVYAVTTTVDAKLTATVTPANASGYAPAVYIRKSCGSVPAGDELACKSTSTANAAVVAEVKYAPAGTYFVWVDAGTSTSSGNFRLDVQADLPVYPPANDTCSQAEALAPGTAVAGSIQNARNDYSALLGSCSLSAAGSELVYTYTPAASGPFTVSMVPTGFDAVLWMTAGSCGAPQTCLAQSDAGGSGTNETLSVNGVRGTTYYFYADAYSSTATGTFTIKVQ